jgi:hypothetical protein
MKRNNKKEIDQEILSQKKQSLLTLMRSLGNLEKAAETDRRTQEKLKQMIKTLQIELGQLPNPCAGCYFNSDCKGNSAKNTISAYECPGFKNTEEINELLANDEGGPIMDKNLIHSGKEQSEVDKDFNLN